MANMTGVITLSPDDFLIPTSGGCERGYLTTYDRQYLAYDDTTVEAAKSKVFEWPADYAGSGTVKVKLFLIAASATSGKFDFDVSVEAITPADAVDLDGAESFDTANSGDVTVGSTAGYLFTLVISLANKDSVAAGDLVRVKVERDADDGTNDTASGDARLLSAKIYEE